MENIIFLVVCLILFIVQIIMLIKAVKLHNKKNWKIVFGFVVIPLVILIGLICYYGLFASKGGFMSGIQYFQEILISTLFIMIYFVMFCITCITCIIKYKKN